MKNMKKVLALVLATVLLLGLVACGDNSTTQTPTEPKPTQTPEEAAVLKVLTLGHSLALDANYMLALVAAAEGVDNLVVGTLYYSGCSLNQHVKFLKADSKEYELHLSSSDNVAAPPTVKQNISMGEALRSDYWDVVVMQGGVFEIAVGSTYKMGAIETIQEYVLQNVPGIVPTLAWNMTWAPPTDNALRDTYPHTPNTYYTNYDVYKQSRDTMFGFVASSVQNNVANNDTFAYVIPSGTAFENALTSYMEEADLHRDYVHASDLGRLMTAYVWYCRLMGIEKLDTIKLDTIPKAFLKSIKSTGNYKLTDMEKKVIVESVNNALANPYAVTNSQYPNAN